MELLFIYIVSVLISYWFVRQIIINELKENDGKLFIPWGLNAILIFVPILNVAVNGAIYLSTLKWKVSFKTIFMIPDDTGKK